MKIDFIYIINLRTSKEEIKHKLEQIPWSDKPDYHILDAINGWEVIKDPTKSPYKFKLADWWKIDSDEKFYKRKVTPGEMGNTLSHYHCIELAHKAGYNNVLILEEDFINSGNFPTKEMFDNVPKDASIVYLGRVQIWHSEWETAINNNITRVGYSWGQYSYIVTKKGMEEVLESTILDNIITPDEFFPAINGTSNRKDAVEIFENIEFQAYSFNEEYFTHSSHPEVDSLTEFDPKLNNNMKYQIFNNFITDDDLLSDIEKNKEDYLLNYDQNRWHIKGNPSVDIFTKIINYTWKDCCPITIDFDSEGFEYWTNVLNSDVKERLPPHLDKDEEWSNKTNKIVSPKIGCVYYPAGQEFEGGELQIYLDGLNNPPKIIKPELNSLIIFDAGKYYHEVKPVTKGSRRILAMNLWEKKPHLSNIDFPVIKHGNFVMSSTGLHALECNKVIDFIEKNIKESDKIINHEDKKGFSEVDTILFKTVSNSITDFIANSIKNTHYLLTNGMEKTLQDIKDSGYELIKVSTSTELQPCSVDTLLSQNEITFNIASLIMSLKDTGNEIIFPDLDITIPLEEGTVVFFPPYWTHCYYINSTEQQSYIVKTNITNTTSLIN